jgi:hypothetical protein
MAEDPSRTIDAISKALEMRQSLVMLIFGAVGFVLAQQWADRAKKFNQMLPCAISAGLAIGWMLLEQRRIVLAIINTAYTDLSQHWLNSGQWVLDGLIILSAMFLVWGLRK